METGLKKQKILIVDDTAMVAEILKKTVERHYAVTTAANGKEALEIVSSEEIPDLILMDIVMPEMNGYELCRILKAGGETADIPVIFVTSDTDDRTLEKAFEAGGADYVRKPAKKVELLARIKSVLRQQRLTRELLQKEKLKGVLEMAGSVCHELNQPMQIISGYSEMIMMDVPEDSPVYDDIAIVKEQIELMGKITRKLMGITRYRTRKYMGKRDIIDIDLASGAVEKAPGA